MQLAVTICDYCKEPRQEKFSKLTLVRDRGKDEEGWALPEEVVTAEICHECANKIKKVIEVRPTLKVENPNASPKEFVLRDL